MELEFVVPISKNWNALQITIAFVCGNITIVFLPIKWLVSTNLILAF